MSVRRERGESFGWLVGFFWVVFFLERVILRNWFTRLWMTATSKLCRVGGQARDLETQGRIDAAA